MADNWSFVLAAYGLAAVVLVAYWRHLVRRERDLERERGFEHGQPGHEATTERSGVRSQAASISAHPRSKPDSRPQ